MPSNTDDLAYKIYLTRIASEKATLPRDTCRSRTAVFAFGWLDHSRPERGVCQHCVDEELNVSDFNTAREMGRLVESELHDSPEKLADSAQFLEDWWNNKTAPPFIEAFIARHLRQPPWHEIAAAGVARSAVREAADPVALDAARVALLMMRGALAKTGHETRPDIYLVAPPGQALSPMDAAVALAAMPKPVTCRSVVRDGYMAITCAPLHDPHGLSAHQKMNAYREQRGGFGARRPSVAGLHRVYCLGAGESLIVEKSAVDRAFSDYKLHPAGGNADEPAFYLATNPAAAREAHANGAATMMKCYFGPDDWAREESGQTIALRGETGRFEMVLEHTPTTLGLCERCGVKSAEWDATDVSGPEWTQQAICADCAIPLVEPMARLYVAELNQMLEAPSEERYEHPDPVFRIFNSLHQNKESIYEQRLRSIAKAVEQTWRILPAPAFVNEALARYKNHI